MHQDLKISFDTNGAMTPRRRALAPKSNSSSHVIHQEGVSKYFGLPCLDMAVISDLCNDSKFCYQSCPSSLDLWDHTVRNTQPASGSGKMNTCEFLFSRISVLILQSLKFKIATQNNTPLIQVIQSHACHVLILLHVIFYVH